MTNDERIKRDKELYARIGRCIDAAGENFKNRTIGPYSYFGLDCIEEDLKAACRALDELFRRRNEGI